jgi:hypothetical protein
LLDALPASDETRGLGQLPDEGVHESGFPDASLASHEDHLPYSARGVREPRPELRDVGFATDEDGHWRPGVRGRREPQVLASSVHDSSDPSIAASVHRLDEPRLAPGIAEDSPQFVHASDEHVLGHVHLRPDLLQQLVLGHQPARPGHQVLEDGERLTTQGNDLVAAVQTRVRRVERKGGKADQIRPLGR